MARLEVQFDLVTANAFAQGQEAGKKFADGFYAAFGGHGGVSVAAGGKNASAGIAAQGEAVLGEKLQNAVASLTEFSLWLDFASAHLNQIADAGKNGSLYPKAGKEEKPPILNGKEPFGGLGEVGSGGGGIETAAAEGAEGAVAEGVSAAFLPELAPFIAAIDIAAIGMKALNAVMDGLKAVVNQIIEAFSNAKKLYATATTSGFGLQGSAQRSSLAQIIGVGENEVFQYASSFNYLNDKLKFSSGILAQTAPGLTKVSYDFGVLKKDFEALAAVIAAKLAPVIDVIINIFDRLIRYFTLLVKNIGSIVTKLIDLIEVIADMVLPAFAASIAKVGLEIVKKAIKSLSSKDSGLEQPAGFMKQLPSSQWERLGLVLGMGVTGQNHAKDTATNTRKTYEAINKLVKTLSSTPFQPLSHTKPLPSRP